MCDILEEFKQECYEEGYAKGKKQEAKLLINAFKALVNAGMTEETCLATLQKTKEDYLQALELVGNIA